ncbi:LysR family transcriptional regulator [Hyalangium sp.]|uniref:LysR family transcriptional regulator n=1 Tax=Hyalangium sp. TaxID=2028555 RepID=UPI002D2E013D|nr:LysR family transcriptional regulator [Hyalangium sp.]HYI02732.1 LysR family transcriptional regulator [Hyalangium sp.]
MPPPRLASVDLNLLIALDTLLREKNVTRAAARLGISQSAMSHSLRRMRTLFDDPLFVSTPRGVLPTPRAQELAGPIERILKDVEHVLDRPRFEPATAQRRFRIIASDYTQLVVLPPLVRYLAQHAPGIDLVFRTAPSLVFQRLERGDADLAIGLFDAEMEGGYRQELFHEEFVCLVRARHPVVRRGLTLERFIELPHALVSPRESEDGGIVDTALAKLGKKRRVSLSVPHFLVAPYAIAGSDMVLTTPARIAHIFEKPFNLRMLRPPLELPGFTMSQYWHERSQHDPGHAWLRGLLRQLSQGAHHG